MCQGNTIAYCMLPPVKTVIEAYKEKTLEDGYGLS